MVEFLLQEGVDPGRKQLHFASYACNNDVLKLLFKYKAELNVAGEDDEALLSVAIRGKCGKETVELLFKCGAKPNLIAKYDEYGRESVLTTLELANRKDHDIAKLVKAVIDGEIIYAPEACPSHPDYAATQAVEIDVAGDSSAIAG